MTMDIEYADIDDIPDTIDIQPYMYEPLPRPNVQESSEESDVSDVINKIAAWILIG